MKRFAFLLLTGLPLVAQRPAEFEDLQIVYRLEPGPRIIETRSGVIRLDSESLASVLGQVLLPPLNAGGEAALKELTLLRGGEAKPLEAPPRQTSRSAFVWPVAGSKAGDRIRFSTEQPVDFTMNADGGWWYRNATLLPLPAASGSVRVDLPAGFAGRVASEDAPNAGSLHEWSLSGSARFVVSSFASWAEFGGWALRQCPVGQLSDSFEGNTAEQIAIRVFDRIRVVGSNTFPCRSVGDVLASGTATPIEAASVFAAALAQRGIAADRLLLSAADASDGFDPSAFSGALVKIAGDQGPEWFDAAHLDRKGLRLSTGMESALPLLAAGASLLAPLVANPEVRLEPGEVNAAVEAEISSLGTLQGSVLLEMKGSAGAALERVGSFLKDRKVGGTPETTSSSGRLTRRIVIREDQFAPPIERYKQTPLNTVPLAPEPTRLADGGVYLGAPGVYREQIEIELPANRRVTADADINLDRPFARYRSLASVESGRLVITRQWEIKTPYVGPADASDARSLLGRVRRDQERSFGFERFGPVDWNSWIDSIPLQELNQVAFRAYSPNGEYEAAFMMMERANKANPKDPYPWNLLSALQASVGNQHAARASLQKLLELQPNNAGAQVTLDIIRFDLGEAESVFQEAQAASEAKPGDRAALNRLATATVQAGKWNEAEEAYLRLADATKPPQTSSAPQMLPLIRACLGTSDDPAREIAAGMGNVTPVSVGLPINTLRRCGKHLEIADSYCEQFFKLMEPFISSLTSDLPSLTAFPMRLSTGLRDCGLLKLKQGEMEAGLELIRAGALISSFPFGLHQSAQAFWDAGRKEEAKRMWEEAAAFAPEMLADVPEEIREQVRTADNGRVFPGWKPVPGMGEAIAASVEQGAELYFIVRADAAGRATRVFDLNRTPAPAVQRTLSGLQVPVVSYDGRSIPTVQLVMVRNVTGNVEVFRGFSPALVGIVRATRPDLFAPPRAQARP